MVRQCRHIVDGLGVGRKHWEHHDMEIEIGQGYLGSKPKGRRLCRAGACHSDV